MGKQRTTAALLFFFLLCLIHVPEAPGGEQRNGIPAAQTGENSSRELIPRDGFRALFANDQMAGLDTFVIYLLQHDQLVQTKFYFPQKHVKTDLFFEDFARVEEFLRKKLGAPATGGEFWRSGTRYEKSDAGRMIAVGELTLKSQWETEDMVIIHSLRGESLDIDHEVNYISKRLSPAAAEVMREIRPKHFF